MRNLCEEQARCILSNTVLPLILMWRGGYKHSGGIKKLLFKEVDSTDAVQFGAIIPSHIFWVPLASFSNIQIWLSVQTFPG